MEYENREKLIVGQYEDKLRSYHNEMVFNDSLKKSQIISTEERLTTINQQLHAQADEIRFLKQTNEQLR